MVYHKCLDKFKPGGVRFKFGSSSRLRNFTVIEPPQYFSKTGGWTILVNRYNDEGKWLGKLFIYHISEKYRLVSFYENDLT